MEIKPSLKIILDGTWMLHVMPITKSQLLDLKYFRFAFK